MLMREAGAASAMPAAVRAFDAVADSFDERFGRWLSVAAQRRAVRRELLRVFPPGAQLLELGGGTGEDALFLATHNRRVLLTDGAPAMLAHARAKIARAGCDDRIATQHVLLEELDAFTRSRPDGAGPALAPPYQGAYSNFAALNCVRDLPHVARGLARLLAPGAHALLVVFGPFAPGEVLVQLLRGDVNAAFRRLARHGVRARLASENFVVDYPAPRAVARAFAPHFRLLRTRGIGVFVPPSAAEPAISRYPRVLAVLESLDRLAAAPLAWLGDHVLLDLERT